MPEDPLLEEYKILQAKIDKIGDYRFVIKGWSTTIVIGLALGTTAASVPSYVILFGVPVVGLFWLMELNQTSLQKVLGKRAAALERAYDSLSTPVKVNAKPYPHSIGPVPGIANTIIQSAHRSRGVRRVAILLSDRLFYLLQAVLLVIAFLVYSRTATPPPVGTLYNINYGGSPTAPTAANPAGKESSSDAAKTGQPGGKQIDVNRQSTARPKGAQGRD